MKFMLTTSLFLTFFLGTGCQKEDFNLPVEFEFQLLDENGNPSTVVQEGESFSFNLVIQNRSSIAIGYDPAFIDDDFFHVYRIDISEGEVSMGKPYSNVFCEFTGSSFIIPSDDERRFKIPWIPPADFCCPPFCIANKNHPLPKGKYKTSIEGPFDFTYLEKSISITNRMEIIFEII